MSAATVVSASGVWKIDYAKSNGKEEGRKGKREGRERESTVIELLPRLRRAAALLSGRRGGG